MRASVLPGWTFCALRLLGLIAAFEWANVFEEKVIGAVRAQLPASFKASAGTEGVAPQAPEKALRSFRTKPGLKIELVAAEPLIQSPVAIDWGADGKLWVCEMNDYPSGVDGNWKPGGRVKFLQDANGDGAYENATVFIDQLPFPTGVTAWGRGAFVCAAPDIIYAEDTNGDGKADKIEKLFSGFPTDNYQARVNSLSLGLDNWIYGANGLLGGNIEPVATSFFPRAKGPVNIRNHDFRIHPFSGAFEVVSGLSQQGRVRDDWDNWYGCNNSELLLGFWPPQKYLSRNPHVPAPSPVRALPTGPDANRIYPTSRMLERFNDPAHANRVTSACGLGIYRDTLLGEDFYGNAFTCEPVHNLVHREIIDGRTSRRAADEQNSEFLSSADNWFRPVQARTGPDGALYVVDMYRFLVEHPRWIPAARLAQLDIRAGADKGRIYRVVKEGATPRPIRDLTKLNATSLAQALDTPNGTERDRVHLELLLRRDERAAQRLKTLATMAALPQARVQALAALDGLSGIDTDFVKLALKDGDERVRTHAIRVAEPMLDRMLEAVLALTNDSSIGVARQLAFSLGESSDRRAGEGLVALVKKWPANADIRVAVFSSARPHAETILSAVGAQNADWTAPLIATIIGAGDQPAIARAVKTTFGMPAVLAKTLAFLEQRKISIDSLFVAGSADRKELDAAIKGITKAASDANAPEQERQLAIALLGPSDVELLCRLARDSSENVRTAALANLKRQRGGEIADTLLRDWPKTSPAARAQITALLLDREEWTLALLRAVEKGGVRAQEISIGDRQRLAESGKEEIRKLAAQVLPAQASSGRDEVLAQYESALTLTGEVEKGADVFARNCADCHQLNGAGSPVGPDLAALRSKDIEYWIKNILDPNAVIEPRYIAYDIELNDDRGLSGVIRAETANSLTLVSGSGIAEMISRSDIRDIRASSLSLMPEGLEQAINPQDMADLVAYLRSGASRSEVLRDAPSVARFVLDAKNGDAAREAAIQANPQFAAALITEMTREIKDSKEEYTRIPWIWRVAIACGKRNDARQIAAMLETSLPKSDEPLRHWQAVVIGGGIINGLSLRDIWPGERIEEILKSNAGLQGRWARALDFAATMTDDQTVPTGTRYDALRMIALEPWEKTGEQLARYLAKGTHTELQMGAVSGLVDMNSPQATAALLASLKYLEGGNRDFAVAGLMRNKERIVAVMEAIEKGTVSRDIISAEKMASLKTNSDPEVRKWAEAVLR